MKLPRVMALTAGLIAFLMVSGTAAAYLVPPKRPTWDFTQVEAMPKPMDMTKAETDLRFLFSVDTAIQDQPFVRPDSYATFWTPALARLWLYRYADNNLLTDEQLNDRWKKEKGRLSSRLVFQVYLFTDRLEYAGIDRPGTQITNVILVDEQGRRFASVKKYSGQPEVGQWYGKVGYATFNEVEFPFTDSAGDPIFTPKTKSFDLYLTSAVGKAKFHFDFLDF